MARYLEKNEFFTTTAKDVDAFSGTILIDGSSCKKNCKYVWSRMSVVEIQKTNGKDKKPGQMPKTEKMGCGIGFIKGRCDDPDRDNVLNCLWYKANEDQISKCTSDKMIV